MIDRDTLAPVFVRNPILAVLPDEARARLAERFRLETYRLGEEVFREGDPGDAYFVVAKGRARVLHAANGAEITLGLLEAGDGFGEQALLETGTRQATVRAASDLALLRLSRDDWNRLVGDFPALEPVLQGHIRDRAVQSFLKLSNVFGAATPRQLQDILAAIAEASFDAGAWVFRQGDPGDAFYIVREGTAEVVKEREGGRVISTLRAGDGFGELALLHDAPRSAGVRAATALRCLKLGKDDFRRVLEAAPKVKERITWLARSYPAWGDEQPYGRTTSGRRPVFPELANALAGADESSPGPSPSAGPSAGIGDAASAEEGRDLDLARPAARAAGLPTPSPGLLARVLGRFPVLIQTGEADCGPTALAMVARYYGVRLDLGRLRDLAGCAAEGATLDRLAEAAEASGFTARGMRVAADQLESLELPAIAHWGGGHYVVIYEVKRGRAVIGDPAIGLGRLPIDEARRRFTGALLLLRPTPDLARHGAAAGAGGLGRLWSLLAPDRGVLGHALAASVLLQVLKLATPLFTQLVVDEVLAHDMVRLLDALLLGVLVVVAFQGVMAAVRHYLLLHAGMHADMRLRSAFFSRLLRLPLRFFQRHRTGDLLARFEDAARIRRLLTGEGLLVLIDAAMVLVYAALLFAFHPALFGLASAFIVPVALVAALSAPRLRALGREAARRTGEAEAAVVEAVSGVATVKALGAERAVRWRWEELATRALRTGYRGQVAGIAVEVASVLLRGAAQALILWHGAHLVLRGELSVGGLMAAAIIASQVFAPVARAVELWHELQDVSVAAERLDEVLEADPDEDPDRRPIGVLPPIRGHVRLERVTYAYDGAGGRAALQNIDLEAHPGELVAVVGRSGAGKTTLANILVRLLRPTSGRVLIDGIDLAGVSAASLRPQVGYVAQMPQLFSGTVAENVALGRPEVSRDEVVAASMLAGAHELITRLPHGYDTPVGEGGTALSGGQRQRLALARALVGSPRLLVLDEATGHLDAEGERHVLRAIRDFLRDRTVILISPRLASARDADRIVVLDEGVVVEQGNHHELMRLRGLYYHLHAAQVGD